MGVLIITENTPSQWIRQNWIENEKYIYKVRFLGGHFKAKFVSAVKGTKSARKLMAWVVHGLERFYGV
jgi:hypothetical protein